MAVQTAARKKEQHFAVTLARGLEILLCFKPGETALGNGDLVARTGLDKATVSRLTFTLTQLGYLRHDAALRKYRLGSPVLSMGYPLLASMHVRQIARPLMRELADHVNGTVAMGIRDRIDMVYVETYRSEGSDAPYGDIGVSYPLMATAIGRAWLAKATPQQRQAALNQTKVRQPAIYAANIQSVTQALRDFDRLGFCINQAYLRHDRYAVAVPLTRMVDSEIIVFNCSVSVGKTTPQAIEQTIAPRLVTLARNVEVAMGLR